MIPAAHVAVAFFMLAGDQSPPENQLRLMETERVRTDTETREVYRQVELGTAHAASVRFMLRETLLGTTQQTSSVAHILRDTELTTEENATFFSNLAATGILDAPPGEPYQRPEGYSLHLELRVGGRDIPMRNTRVKPPPGTPLGRVIGLCMDLANRLGMARAEGTRFARLIRSPAGSGDRLEPYGDERRGLRPAVVTVDGDLVPAVEVSLARLLSDRDRYDGRRVAVSGYWFGAFECSNLGSREGPPQSMADYALWLGEPSSRCPERVSHPTSNSWLRVEGTFLKGPAGHLGLWPGEIERVTRIDVLDGPPPE